MALNSANFRLTADNKDFIAAMREASGAVGELTARVSIGLTNAYKDADYLSVRLERGIGRLGGQFTSLGQSMMYVSGAILATAGASLEAYSRMEALRNMMATIEPTTSKVNDRMAELLQLSKQPGLGFEQTVQADVKLRGLAERFVGVTEAATLSTRIISAFGNAVARNGGGKEQFGFVQYNLGQLFGNIDGENIRALADQVPQIKSIMQDLYGTTEAKGIKDKGITPVQFIKDLTTELEKMPKIAGGVKNSWENFTDSVFLSSATVGEAIAKGFGISEKLDILSSKLIELSNWFSALDPSVQKVIGTLGALGIATGPALLALGFFTSNILPKMLTGWNSLANSIGKVSSALNLSNGWGALKNDLSSITGVLLNNVAGMGAEVASMAKMEGATFSLTEAVAGFKPELFGMQAQIASLPAGLLSGAGAVVALTAVLGGLAYAFLKYNEAQVSTYRASQELEAVQKTAMASYAKEVAEMNALIAIAKTETNSKSDRANAIERLNKLSPEYIHGLTLENINTEQVAKMTDAYTASLHRNALAKAASAKIEELAKKQLDIKEEIDKSNSALAKKAQLYKDAGSSAERLNSEIGSMADLVDANVVGTESERINNLRHDYDEMSTAIERLTKMYLLKNKAEAGGGTPSTKGALSAGGEADSMADIKHRIEMMVKEKELIRSRNELLFMPLPNKATRIKENMELESPTSLKLPSIEKMQADIQQAINREWLGSPNLNNLTIPQLRLKIADVQIQIDALDRDGKKIPDFLKKEMEALKSALDPKAEFAKKISASFSNLFSGFIDSIGSAMASGDWSAARKSILGSIGSFMQEIGKQVIVTAALFEGIAEAMATAITNPWLLAAAGIALIAGGAAIKQLAQPKKMASGGVAYGTTFAMVGEYAGANHNPEIVAPLNKMLDLLIPPINVSVAKAVSTNNTLSAGGGMVVQVMPSLTREGAGISIYNKRDNKRINAFT